VRYFSPKLLTFLGLSGFLYLTRTQLDLIDITSRLPANIYDVRRIDGLRFGTSLYHDLTLRNEIDEKAIRTVRQQQGATVLDVGANIVAYALRYATIVGPSGQVVAFEPVPHNRRILAWNIKLNSLWNVSVRPEALGDFDGKATLNLS